MIMTSGAMFHLSATMFKSAGIDEVEGESDLAKDVAYGKIRGKKSRAENNPPCGGPVMGNLFKPGNSRPNGASGHHGNRRDVERGPLFESDASEPDSSRWTKTRARS
jgi:hypothetical protein